MMRITHKLKTCLRKDLDDTDVTNRNLSLFLLNNRGHYLALSANPRVNISNFYGWLNFSEHKDGYALYKTIENIYLTDEQGNICKPLEIINTFSSLERIYDSASERFTLAKNGLIYDVSENAYSINIFLDFREINDYDDKGRIYNIAWEKMPAYQDYEKDRQENKKEDKKERERHSNILIIEYSKYKDNDLKVLDKKLYLAIHGACLDTELPRRWEKRFYDYDASRNSRAEFYVYKALKILCKKNSRLIFGFSEKKEHAISKVSDILMNLGTIRNVQDNFREKTLEYKYKISELSDIKTALGYVNCVNAIEGLEMHLLQNRKKLKGLWAGLPWFYQFWARDELISLKSLVLEKKHETAKEILFRQLNNTTIDGRIMNIHPGIGLGSADGVGWLFKRLEDFIGYAEYNNMLNDYFSFYDLKYIRERLKYSIKQLLKNYSKEGLIFNNALETWMDTSYKDAGYETDVREGFRIEIQALFLSMLKLMNKLNDMFANKFVKKSEKMVDVTENDLDYKKMERVLRDLVREKFLIKSRIDDDSGEKIIILADGYDCSYADVVRPNIFLAFYIYPELLSETEWESVFDHAIDRLWSDWSSDDAKGGFSTIDKKHVLYHPIYTGQNNKSYHRGDSWFFLNNIAAICLIRLNKNKYDNYIKKIINASTEDILFSGFVGYPSEISSSSVYKPGGCLCQTWSVATFIELIHELYL